MTLRLAARQAKEELIDNLRRLLHAILFPHLDMAQRDAVMEWVAWMKRQPGEMSVNCKFETVPELALTRVVIETSFAPLEPMTRQ